MKAEKLTERQRTALEHLKQAQELGSSLPDYATAFGLNVKALYNGRAQLQRKGLWPKVRHTQRPRPELLSVQVVEPAAPKADEDWVCRLIGPGGWVMECRHLPAVSWLSALSTATGKVSA